MPFVHLQLNSEFDNNGNNKQQATMQLLDIPTAYTTEKSAYSATTLTIAQYNVLFDIVDQDKTFPLERYQYQVEKLLPALNADIISLNEVTKTYSDLLVKTLKKQYHVLQDPSIKTQADYFGNIILTKLPVISALMFPFSKMKRPGIFKHV